MYVIIKPSKIVLKVRFMKEIIGFIKDFFLKKNQDIRAGKTHKKYGGRFFSLTLDI